MNDAEIAQVKNEPPPSPQQPKISRAEKRRRKAAQEKAAFEARLEKAKEED